LVQRGYDPIVNQNNQGNTSSNEEENQEEEEEEVKEENQKKASSPNISSTSFNYLLQMPLWNLTEEKVSPLMNPNNAISF